MFRMILFVAFVFGSVVSKAETMEWNFESRTPYQAQLNFFSKTYNREWPGGGKSYTLYKWQDYQYVLNCTPGEQICYGVSTIPNESKNWGVGIHNNRGCTACCRTCGAGPIKMVLE